MSDISVWTTKITICNKPLYAFLKKYTYRELKQRGLGITNISTLSERNNTYKLQFADTWDDCDIWTEHHPESLQDVATCFLIFLGLSLPWRDGQFTEFKELYLREMPAFEKHYERVYWETKRCTFRSDDLDGTYRTIEKLSYDKRKNEFEARYNKVCYKDTYRHESYKDINSRLCADYKKELKYYDYDWDQLDGLIKRNNS